MGREIRMVPKDWKHPKDENGSFIPLIDRTFKEEADKWVENCISWANGTHEDFAEHGSEYPYYWQWNSEPPKDKWFRQGFTSEPTCYQIYETVSEGTPVSPVFDTKENMVNWLVKGGQSRISAERFAETGWVPSMVMSVREGVSRFQIGIDSLDD